MTSEELKRIYDNKRSGQTVMHVAECTDYNCPCDALFKQDVDAVQKHIDDLEAENARLREALSEALPHLEYIDECCINRNLPAFIKAKQALERSKNNPQKLDPIDVLRKIRVELTVKTNPDIKWMKNQIDAVLLQEHTND